MATLTETLRKAISDSGVTFYRIANDTGLDFMVVTRFYRGERDLRLETAQKLCDYFGLELRPKEKRKAKRKRHK